MGTKGIDSSEKILEILLDNSRMRKEEREYYRDTTVLNLTQSILNLLVRLKESPIREE